MTVKQTDRYSAKLKLNLGAGHQQMEGYVNLDKEQCDLNKAPLPFADRSVDEIYLCHVMEHLETKPSAVMKELLRILKDDGVIKIRVPHFSWHNAYDEDHERFFNYNSFSLLHKSNIEKEGYEKVERKVKIKFFKLYFFYNYLVEPIVNLNKITALLYESTFLCRLFPANELYFEIRKVLKAEGYKTRDPQKYGFSQMKRQDPAKLQDGRLF